MKSKGQYTVTQVILAVIIMSSICYILTETDVFTEKRYPTARTSNRLSYMQTVPWFQFPYPGIIQLMNRLIKICIAQLNISFICFLAIYNVHVHVHVHVNVRETL